MFLYYLSLAHKLIVMNSNDVNVVYRVEVFLLACCSS